MRYCCENCDVVVVEAKIPRCPKCGNVYDLQYKYGKDFFRHISEPISHWKYRDFMPINYQNTKIISMNEGGTPLIPSRLIPNLLFKCEYVNPTGSFKDRGSALEITLAQGKDEIVVASTGNMGSSIAAYAAYAGMKCRVFIPEDIYNDRDSTKITHMKMCGATIIPIGGSYTDAMFAAEQYSLSHPDSQLAGDYGIRIEGTKSIGFEIADQLDWSVPEYIIIQIGNGTLLYAIYKAFSDLHDAGIIHTLPKIIGVRSDNPATTIASAIACPDMSVDYLVKKTAHLIITVTDREIMLARTELAMQGLYVEPGGAAAMAGYNKLTLPGSVVVLLTGSGYKGV